MVPLKWVVKNSHAVYVYLSATESDTVYDHIGKTGFNSNYIQSDTQKSQ